MGVAKKGTAAGVGGTLPRHWRGCMNQSLTASQRLLKEGLDRILGRLSAEQRQVLALQWCSLAASTLAPRWLEEAGLKAEAKTLAGMTALADLGAAEAAREKAKTVGAAADAARRKEEEDARGATEGPATQASKAASYALEAIKAALGEAGMKVKVSGPGQAPVARPVVDVDGNQSRALLAARYAALLAGMAGGTAAEDLEQQQKQDAVNLLKAPKKI